MRTPRPRSALALLVLPGLLAAPAARARCSSPIVWPGAELAAGTMVELAWEAPPQGVEEIEILLSLDDGRTFPVHVTPELDAHVRRYRWRVPDLPAARARLLLCLGAEGIETGTEPTSAFRIMAAPLRTPPVALFHDGTWWTSLTPLERACAAGLSPPTHFDPGMRAATAAESPPRAPLAWAAAPTAPPAAGATDAAPRPREAPVAPRPRHSPLRN